MLICAFESSVAVASVALWQDGDVLAESSLRSGNTHSTTLLPLASRMLADCGLTVSDVNAFACALGPGSFTGLRIGASTVKGLAFGRNVSCVGVSSLLALAYAARSCGGVICPLLNARRGQFYAALFRVENGRVVRLTEDDVVLNADVAALLTAHVRPGETVTLTGDGASLVLPWCDGVPDVRTALPRLTLPSAFAVAEAAADALAAAPDPSVFTAERLNPVYLRPTEAERNLKAHLLRSAFVPERKEKGE